MNPFNQPIGAYYKDDQITFTVWAPQKKSVEVVITAPDHQIIEMKKDDFGYWKTNAPGKPGTRYFYKLDRETERPDPASLSQPDGVHEASEVVNRASHSWTDFDWKGLKLEEMVMYELHVGTFTEQHTFEGIISKLEYLKELGINTIEIMPIAQFPGDRNWGYDGVYPFAVQHSYGGINGFKKLIDAAHKNGIAVILDVVYNHMGPEGNYLNDFGPYFTDRYKTPWGKAMNFDDSWCDGVRNFFLQNALMWLDEFHIDGLRLDAVHAIWDFNPKHLMQELKERVADLEHTTGRKKVLIAEIDLNNVRYINPVTKGGYGLDGQWIDEFHHALHSLLTGEKDGYYADFGEINMMEKSLRDTYVYTGNFSIHRKKMFGSDPKDNPYGQFVVFTQNHDQVGNRMLGDRLTSQLSFEAQKIAAATMLLSPYVPMIFMGEEYGEKNPFQYFVSHTDPDLVQAVREGRKKEFSHFKWKGEVPDPQSEETFKNSTLSWAYQNNPEQEKLFQLYRHLIGFRKDRLALQGKARDTMVVYPSKGKVLAFERNYKIDYLVILINFGKEKGKFNNLTLYPLKKIFDSSSKEWGGPGEITDPDSNSKEDIYLNPESVVIFEKFK